MKPKEKLMAAIMGAIDAYLQIEKADPPASSIQPASTQSSGNRKE